MRRTLLIVFAYALMCAIWGTTWLGIKIDLRYVPPFFGVGVRFTIAAMLLFAVGAARRELLGWRALPWRLVLVLTFCLFGLNYALSYTAEEGLSSGLTAILFGTLPFFTFFYAKYLVGERATSRIWIGATFALAGVTVISLGEMHGSLPYALAAMGAAALAGFANVYAKRHAGYAPLAVLPPAMLLAGFGMTAVGLVFEHPDMHRLLLAPSLETLFYLAVLGSAIAFFLNLWLLRHVDAWVVNMSALIIPVIAVFVGMLFGNEHVGPREAVGAALVIAGMWFALSGGTQRAPTAEAELA